MKKLINDPAEVIGEALRGMAVAHPELRVDHANRNIYRGDAPVAGKVGRQTSPIPPRPINFCN
jgi:phosphoenolpyruvate---glycerone phosphotransferase subunit DhaK